MQSRLGKFSVEPFSLGAGGFGLSYKSEVLAAPIYSRDFERRIVVDVPTIKSLIKEVTLGSHPSP
jgi:hypothetical protein